MDDGPEQADREARRHEPDALDLWLNRQLRAWWRRWRWALVLVTAAMLAEPLVRAAASIPPLSGLAEVLRWYPSGLNVGAAYVQTRLPLALISCVVIASAAAALCLSLCRLPAELAVVLPRRETYLRTAASARAAGWILVAAAIVLPELLDKLVRTGTGRMFTSVDSACLVLDAALTCLLMIEAAIWLVLRQSLTILPYIAGLMLAVFLLEGLLHHFSVQLLLGGSTMWPGGYCLPSLPGGLLKLAGIALLWLSTRRGVATPPWER